MNKVVVVYEQGQNCISNTPARTIADACCAAWEIVCMRVGPALTRPLV